MLPKLLTSISQLKRCSISSLTPYCSSAALDIMSKARTGDSVPEHMVAILRGRERSSTTPSNSGALVIKSSNMSWGWDRTGRPAPSVYAVLSWALRFLEPPGVNLLVVALVVFGAALFLVGAVGDLAPIIIAKALAGLPAGALGALVASFFDAILSGAARAKDE